MVHPKAKVSEKVNRKSSPWNTTVQLSTPYTDPERNKTFCHRQTEGQTEDCDNNSQSHCVPVQLAKEILHRARSLA